MAEGYGEKGIEAVKDVELVEHGHDVDEAKKRALQGLPVTATPTMAPTTPHCDLDAFDTWKNDAYVGILLTDPSFWRYQTQLQFQLSNGLALDLAVAKCKERLCCYRSSKPEGQDQWMCRTFGKRCARMNACKVMLCTRRR